MNGRVIYNVSYDIPIIKVGMPGRQNRASDGVMRITPGMTECIEFWMGNHDGVPLTLVPFTIKLVFWKSTSTESDAQVLGFDNKDIVFATQAEVLDPYAGKTLVILQSSDTMQIAQRGATNLRWSLFMINSENQVFPAMCSSNGSRYGSVLLEQSLPSAEMILSA